MDAGIYVPDGYDVSTQEQQQQQQQQQRAPNNNAHAGRHGAPVNDVYNIPIEFNQQGIRNTDTLDTDGLDI